MSRALDYATWVLDPVNTQKTGHYIKLAAKRFLSDLKREDLVFDEEQANKYIRFAEESCKLTEDEWEGKPVIITPWRAFIYQQIFGWIVKATGRRRVKKVYIQVAKKNAKSTDCAVVANFHLFSDRIKTPRIFVGSNNEEQSKICVNMAGRMVEYSPDLAEYLEDDSVQLSNYNENITRVIHRTRNGFIKPMAKETESKTSKMAGGKHGFNPSLVLIDEYSMADSSAQLDALESGQAARLEPLEIIITTAGFKKEGPCFTKVRKTGIEVLEGVIENDSFLVFLYEMDKPVEDGKQKSITIDYLLANEDTWEQANPNIDVSVQRAFLKDRLIKAKQEGGSTEVDVKTLNFNEWCDTPEVWIPAEVWDKNTHGMKEEELEGALCYGGLEILQGLDLHCFFLMFPNVKGEIIACLPFFWMADGRVVDNRMKVDCSRWVKDGWIKTCPGDVVDNEKIYLSLLSKFGEFNLHSFACSVRLETHDIVQGLANNGIEWNPISVGYGGQSTPTSMWEEMCTGAKFEHFGNPVLAWMNQQSMIIRSKDGDIKLQRQAGRSSGIIAGIYALAQWKTVDASPPDEVGMEIINL